MGYLSDSLDFEKFFAKDTWDRLKADPKRLVLGVDPASTWAWNKILGRNDEPLVDQMGGPYDGRVFSFGHGNGGVYDRAQAAGIDTRAAQGNHDAAHLIAGSYALGGLGLGGNGAGNSGSTDLFTNAPRTNFSTGMPSTGANPAAGIPGIAGPVADAGGGAVAGGAGPGLGAADYAKLGMGLVKSAQPQQQQVPMAQPNFAQRLNAGIGQAFFPVNPQTTQGLDPSYVSQLQNSALLKLGLGMAGAARQPGATFLSALGTGLGRASNDLDGAMQTAYQNARQARADRRADTADERAEATQQRLIENEQFDRQFKQSESDRAQRNFDAQLKATDLYRSQQLDLDRKRLGIEAGRSGIPSGYELDPNNPGALRPIAGGPADPSVGRGKVTDAERLTAAYAQRMKAAGDTIDSIVVQNPDGTSSPYVPSSRELSAFNFLIGEPGYKQSWANQILSPEAKRYFQALQDFSRAKLRKESGAVIGKDEIAGDLATYFPLPGDDKDTIAQKKAARETALQGMITASGPAWPMAPPSAPAGGRPGGLGQPTSAPAAGAVEDGYRFKGGDPSRPENWEPVH